MERTMFVKLIKDYMEYDHMMNDDKIVNYTIDGNDVIVTTVHYYKGDDKEERYSTEVIQLSNILGYCYSKIIDINNDDRIDSVKEDISNINHDLININTDIYKLEGKMKISKRLTKIINGKLHQYDPEPFTGELLEERVDGSILSSTKYVNGLLDGRSELYSMSGKLTSGKEYVNGLLDGHCLQWGYV